MSLSAVASRISEIQSTLSSLIPTQPAAVRAATAPAAPVRLVTTADTSTSAQGGFAGQLAALTEPATAAGPAGPSGVAAAAGPGGPTGADVVADARRYLGIAYRWGGTDPATGLDCSGLTQRVYADLGIALPRTVSTQKSVGREVPTMASAQPGDLLVFGDHHIGIYVGGGQMLHAPKTGDVVKIAKVYDTPTTIRRMVADPTAAPAVVAAADSLRPAALRSPTGTTFDGLFDGATQRYGLPAGLLKAVARAESGLDPAARSHAGAMGLMQLMPGTARELGVDPTVPSQAVDGAARLLRSHLDKFGSVPLALAAYNAGPGAVRRYAGIPPYGETQAYVRRVQSMMPGAAS